MAELDLSPYSQCTLCPRQCKVDRLAGQLGFCGESAVCRIVSTTPHFGEEPCLTGQKGSGTIFFSGCSCGCFFCQNYQISQGHLGNLLSPTELLERIRQLLATGVHNLNFVTPEHWWPQVKFIVQSLREENIDVPMVWNGSGFTRPEMVAEQAEFFDIFLPDFKYADPELAKRCMGREDYPQQALDSLKVLVDRLGFLRPFDESGEITASRGVMVRHLVLPGEVENSLQVLKLLYENFGDRLPISVMSQFLPTPECEKRQQFTRRVTAQEYNMVCQAIDDYGFRRVFIQPEGGADDFMPDFTQQQPFQGNKKHLEN